jgi:serine/threonine protein kinase
MKVLKKDDIVQANEIRHAISERNVLRDLNSDFVVSFACSFQDVKHLYIVMEYVIGGKRLYSIYNPR